MLALPSMASFHPTVDNGYRPRLYAIDTMGIGTGWTPDGMDRLEGTTFVITGATSGTGFEAVRILLGKGADVLMLNRDEEKTRATMKLLHAEFGSEAPLSAVTMDLSDLNSVRGAGEKVNSMVERIDGLICNAGIAQTPRRTLTANGFEVQMGTNHLGHFLLARLLFDRLAASKGRIVVVSSLGYKMGTRTINFDDLSSKKKYNPNAAYSQSKLAQMMFAYELQDRLSGTDHEVEVYVCHPGASKTSLIKTNGSRLTRAIWGFMTLLPIVQSAEKGAYPSVMCATRMGLEQRALYGPTGLLNWVGAVGGNELEPHAHDKKTMQRLWHLSEELTECTWPL